jgi:hypothetical protein
MLKPLVIKQKHVYWKGFVHLRTSDNVYERRFTILCADRVLMMTKTPIYHFDMIHDNASAFIIPSGSIHTELSLLRIRRLVSPESTTYVCGMPHTLELHCDALPKVFLFSSSKDMEEFRDILSQLMKVGLGHHPHGSNKVNHASGAHDDIVPAASVIWRGWVTIVKKVGNEMTSSSNESKDSSSNNNNNNNQANVPIGEQRLRRYVLLLDSQRFVVTTAPPMLFASDQAASSVSHHDGSEEGKVMHWGAGGYFKIPMGTEEEDISLIKNNTVICFDIRKNQETKVESNNTKEVTLSIESSSQPPPLPPPPPSTLKAALSPTPSSASRAAPPLPPPPAAAASSSSPSPSRPSLPSEGSFGGTRREV